MSRRRLLRYAKRTTDIETKEKTHVFMHGPEDIMEIQTGCRLPLLECTWSEILKNVRRIFEWSSLFSPIVVLTLVQNFPSLP
ncbi:unnamed protein product, partial [Nesidiocoris tenuis]